MKLLIKKILKEETSQFETDEKLKIGVKRMIKILTKDITFPDNFHDFFIDIGENQYGRFLRITTIMDKPFSQDESDYLFSIRKKIKPQLYSFFGNMFYDIYLGGTQTLESYKQEQENMKRYREF